ncbi:MAG TPA: ATP-binding protein [Thermoanaerobaculia bacterium]|nr:ATP-binding protein [Thermoanaerobaculia bacterium]
MGDFVDFRQLFESAPVAYLVLDRHFRIVTATDAFLAATKTERDTIAERDLFDVFPDNPDDPHATGTRNLRASLETVLHTGAPHTMAVQKYDIRRPESEGGGFEERYWTPVNTPVMAGGRVEYIIHEVEDVTNAVRMKELEGQNEKATHELRSMRENDRAKDEFIAIISHELRTPMTSILGWTRMLVLGGLDEETRREALDALERSTLAQAKLIEDLLDESRIASDKLRLELRALDLCAVLVNAISAARPAAEAKGLQLTLACDDGSYDVFGDPSRLQQAIGNLVANAIKFTPEGGSVSVRLANTGTEGRIEVADTGRGIEPDLLPYIFDRFRQGDQSTNRQTGLGLGLSIARHLIELHHGSVAAFSAGEGRGATFTISLPLHKTAATEVITNRDASVRGLALPSLEGVRVLLVEDEIDNRKVLATALRHSGAQVECVGTAADAFGVIPGWPPDVIICDISLPDLDGCTFLTQLRARDNGANSAVPALALTVLGRPGEQARITAAGFEVFRQKPIDPVDLAHEVARLAQREVALAERSTDQ